MNKERIKEKFIQLLPGWMHDNDKRLIAHQIEVGAKTVNVVYEAAVQAAYDEGYSDGMNAGSKCFYCSLDVCARCS